MSEPASMWFALDRFGKPFAGMRGEDGREFVDRIVRERAGIRPGERVTIICIVAAPPIEAAA